MTVIFIHAALILGLSCLGAGWARAGYWSVALVCLVMIPASMYLVQRKFNPTTGLVLIFTTLFAGLGVWAHVELSLALTALVCILGAWDLSAFSQRLTYAAPQDNQERLERQHLLQLNLVLFAGVGINLISQTIRYAFGFEWTLMLAILAFYGLGALVSGLRGGQGRS